MRTAWRALTLLVLTAALTLAAGASAAWSSPPANDSFAGSVDITLPYASGPVDTAEATLDQDDTEVGAACGNVPSDYTPADSVWYAFTATNDAVAVLDTGGSDYPVIGAVVTGSPGSFSAVSCFAGSSRFDIRSGETYHLVLYGASGAGGILQFSLISGQPPTATVAVTGGRFSARSGAATVTGSESCTAGAFGYLFGRITQRVGRIATITGYFEVGLTCDGAPHTWAVPVQPDSGKFAGGKATVSYTYDVSNPFGFVSDSPTTTITLKGQ